MKRLNMTEADSIANGTVALEKDFDFKEDLKINKYKLDEECISHASRYAYYAEAQANAKLELGKARDELDLIKSEASLRLRNAYLESGEKVTENKLTSAIEIDPEVIEAKTKYRELDKIYSTLTVAVNAMDVRRSELDNLVRLYCAGYFSTFTGNGGSKRDINEQTSNEIRKNLNRRDEE